MLEPSGIGIPALFLVMIVLPLVIYILLGKWSEEAKKKETVSFLAEEAAKDDLCAESMTAVGAIPMVPLPNSSPHQCARCYGPATTRCSRCKSVRYCSGKCQIIHWRQIHKEQCLQSESNFSNSFFSNATNEEFHERVSLDGTDSLMFPDSNVKHSQLEKTPADDTSQSPLSMLPSDTAACRIVDEAPMVERQSLEKKVSSRKDNSDMPRRKDRAALDCLDEASQNNVGCSTFAYDTSAETSTTHKIRMSGPMLSRHSVDFQCESNIGRSAMQGPLLEDRNECVVGKKSNSGISASSNSACGTTEMCESQPDSFDGGSILRQGTTSNDEAAAVNCSYDKASSRKSHRAKSDSLAQSINNHKSPRSTVKASRDQSCAELSRKDQNAEEPKTARTKEPVPLAGHNVVTNTSFMKMMGLMKSSKSEKHELAGVKAEKHRKVKMLFPYEEYVKFFQYDLFHVLPRGLVNCGNSCYANAVLQCLTYTKPLTIYLLHGSHSRTCCMRDWCLMCELEQHVMMLREMGEPLSPSRILSHMQNTNSQIGNGSQEDAHEFLRLLVTSMQSICLEAFGGENVVDRRLQETTFIQHTFGGRLKSKVKCLRCHHESERYESIMDLTLEIFGWVESLEDALTQFTSPEDLDGENMYRCGRCASYVRAKKQLSIQEAPNILTIVLKRFQEGSYGKINKSITFPDLLDMIPFMTGTEDIPPLYMLYAVVVHLDTLNASFSGHYISYVKDLQGNWFRIDDTEVQPVSLSQVMSEGAYILFYMRSHPRPLKRKTSRSQALRPDQGKSMHFNGPDNSAYSTANIHMKQAEYAGDGNITPGLASYIESMGMEFPDSTSSDWSLFTSSDDASFTTESTRDSFSTTDYTDGTNIDPISSIFNTFYVPEYSSRRTVACSMFSSSKPLTGFVSESRSFVIDSVDGFHGQGNKVQVNYPSHGAFYSNGNLGIDVNYGAGPETWTFSNFP